MTRPFRFGIQMREPIPGSTWADTARQLEDTGFSTLTMPDHFTAQHAVTPSLTAAASATSDLRLSALVFGNDYRHPVVLAKEMATLDVISGGRMELGLGAGWMRTDYDEAGISYDAPGVRIDRLCESLAVIRGLFGAEPFSFEGDHYTITNMNGLPKPVQPSPPVLIGGGGKRMLTIAAREADIVGVTANLRAGEVGVDAIADVTPERFDEKLEWVRAGAGARFDDIELSVLVMSAIVTDDGPGSRQSMAELFTMSADLIAEVPVLTIGSAGEIADILRARRERWGFSYMIFQGPESIDALAPVVAELAGT